MMNLKKYELTEKDFERFRKLISQASGIFFDRSKMEILRVGLSDRAEAVGAQTLSDYYEFITTSDEREEELRKLLSHLSVQETQFFRNLPQFDALRKYVIPEIAKRKAEERIMRFWCAGCSTGQEPYSVAMSVLEVLPAPDSWNIQILGTDLNEQALEIARRGWYPEKKLTGLDRFHRERYFRPHGSGYMIMEPVKRLVHFLRHNLVTDALPITTFGTCDVVFCRNVIIYFTHETAKFVIEHFFDILNPGGYLFLGHSETLWKMSAKYALVEMGDAFIYRKPLPKSLDGRRFIPDRRLRQSGLPPGLKKDRRLSSTDRRNLKQPHDLLFTSELPAPEQVTEKAEAETQDRPEVTLVKKARAQLDLGEYDKAIEDLKEALKVDGINAEIYFLLGLAYEKKEDLAAAAEAYQKAVYCDADLSLAHFHLASVMERNGKLKHAIREYRCAADSFKKNPPSTWEEELEAFDIDSLVNLCQWKIESLGRA